MSDGKIALVTGGGTGVGKAIAKALLDDGYSVAITGRRGEVLDAAVGEWRSVFLRVWPSARFG